jgi:hypothetical protein
VPRSTSGARRRARLASAAAVIALVLGYGDLAHGGVVVAPLALVIGYVVLLPAALLSH